MFNVEVNQFNYNLYIIYTKILHLTFCNIYHIHR